MEITPDQARDSLHEIHAAASKLRRAVVSAQASGHLILWGLVWMAAFITSGLAPDHTGTAWLVGSLVGTFGSIAIGITSGNKSAISERSAQEGLRFLALWLALFAFIGVWIWLLQPTSSNQMAAFICTAVMFLYVVMGLWFEAGFLGWLGLGVTALTVAGYALLPEHFNYWMAAAGGGSLLVSGLYMQRAWK
jgi:hypothetical protein